LIEDTSDSGSAFQREIVRFQYQKYMAFFFFIYVGSYLAPVIILMFYLFLILKPFFLEVDSIIVILTRPDSLIIFLTLPFVVVVFYLSHLVLLGIFTRISWKFTEKRSPTKDGIIPRDIRSKTADYYHYRSFMIKYGKNAFMKGVFPWLANWFFNFVGASVINKGTTFEESVSNDRNIETGRNCYIGINSALASHLVEGVFGNIIYFQVKLGENVTLGGFNAIAPGCELKDNTYLLPMAAATKFNTTKGNNYYYGMPFRRIFKRKLMEYLKVSEDDLNRAEELRIRQVEAKFNRSKKEEIKNIEKLS
jgi:acetyltransferase-like isoleucine patch superfamily enzyme